MTNAMINLINRWQLWAVALLFTVSVPSVAQDTAAVSTEEAQAALDAANAWLALIDDLNYAESWQQAASLLQEQTNQVGWEQQLRTVRGSLGPLLSRAPQDRERATALPDAPEGEYVIITYGSSYTQLEDAVESVTMVKADDGTWRGMAYTVQPG